MIVWYAIRAATGVADHSKFSPARKIPATPVDILLGVTAVTIACTTVQGQYWQVFLYVKFATRICKLISDYRAAGRWIFIEKTGSA